jgi:abequosyltransferase
MSSLVVRRRVWLAGELPDAFNGSCWGHVARLFGLAQKQLLVCYVAEVWLDQRGENDSFLERGVINRYKIGIEGYHRLADTYWMHNSIEAFHIRRVIRHEFSFRLLLSAKVLCSNKPNTESRQLLDSLVALNYSGDSVVIRLQRYLYVIIPYWALPAATDLYRLVTKFFRKLIGG